MARLILDTGVIIGFERRGADLREVIGDREPAIAAITAMELLSGASRITSPNHDLVGLNVEAMLAVMPITPYTLKVALIHALLQTQARKAGQTTRVLRSDHRSDGDGDRQHPRDYRYFRSV